MGERATRDCEFPDWDTILIPEVDRISFYTAVQSMHCMTDFTDRTPAGFFLTPGCAIRLEKTNVHRRNWHPGLLFTCR
jgi:hypothetical protein